MLRYGCTQGWVYQMRALFIAVASSILTVSCVANTSPPASEQEQDQALDNLFKCVIRNEASLDDGVSDARVIGRALVDGPCFTFASAASETSSRGLSPQAKRIFVEKIPYAYYDVGTSVVLKARADRNIR